MKKVFRYAYIALIGAMAFTATSCSDGYEYDGRGAADDPSKAGAYFADVVAGVTSVEVEPGNEAFTLTIARTNVNGASTVGIEKVDTAGIFEVPTSVTFDAGSTTATISIAAPTAVPGKAYGLQVKIAEADRSNYVDGAQAAVVDYTILSWEDLGVCYWVDGIVSTLFGVDATLAYCSHAYRTVTADGPRYRFDLPYSHVAWDEDGVGYWGYVYNDPGDCDEKDYRAVVDIRAQGAYFNATALGMDWGYGAFSIAPRAYGQVTADALVFAPGSLTITMADWGSTASAEPCYLFFSAEAYLAWLESL